MTILAGSTTLIDLIIQAACAFSMEFGRSARKVYMPLWRGKELRTEAESRFLLFANESSTGKSTIAGLEIVFWKNPWIELQ